jgi:hypothetical protein
MASRIIYIKNLAGAERAKRAAEVISALDLG